MAHSNHAVVRVRAAAQPFFGITGDGGAPYNPDGSVNDTVVGALSRTYPVAVASATRFFTFKNVTAVFNLTYTLGPASAGNTEIFASLQYHYPRGVRVVVSPPGVLSWALRR